MTEKLIVVVGITGQQGSSVGNVFLHEPGWRVRGITRDPSKPTARILEEKGVDMVVGDLDDPSSLVAAFQGAHAIFAVTDFWQFAKDPATYATAQTKNVAPNTICYDRELEQAKNIIDAAASPDMLSTLERFVFSTLSDSKKLSHGKITWNLHFDAKADASKYLAATHPELSSRTSSLQMGFYMTNWRTMSLFSPLKQPGSDGKRFVMRKPGTAPATKSAARGIPWVLPSQDGGHFVRALVLKAPAGTTMLGYSSQSPSSSFCAIWTRVLRERGLIAPDAVCVEDNSMTKEELLQEHGDTFPGLFGEELYETCMYTSEFGFDGGDPDVKSPEECGVDMGKLSDLEDFIRNEDWSSILRA